jgi:hypothetical protein
MAKEDKNPKRSLTKTISNRLLGKKLAVPPVPPRKDSQISKALPAPPHGLDMDCDDASKRPTVATMGSGDSGYQSIDIPSARNSVDSIQ